MKKTCFQGLGNWLKPLLKKGVEEGVFSGAAVGVYSVDKKESEKVIICHGKTKKGEGGVCINENTLFDLASLTKPLCTVLLTLHLIESKKIKEDTSINGFTGAKKAQILKKIKIAHLLSHSSGLKAYEPFYKDFESKQGKNNKARLFDAVIDEKILYSPGEKCIYSDLGFILLGEIVERVSGAKLEEFFQATITKPLGLDKTLMFRPVTTFVPEDSSNIAATQYCPWRKRLLQGEVDDEHAWLMNGVAGHAGLFGTINGVVDLASHLLNQWKGREKFSAYSKALLQKALSRQYSDFTWCMGFDTPSHPVSSAGKYFSEQSVGHLGFTGTSFWIDPETDLIIVLLTNRIHPSRNNDKIKEFRPLLHDTVVEALKNK